LIICPSCGSCVQGDLCLGCATCGARAVGPPLARAEHELPSFGRAALAFAGGVAMLGTFLVLLIAAFIEKKPGAIGFWTLMTAGEIVAWQVKWVGLPVAIAVIWSGALIVRSIKQDPSRFIGLHGARIGLAAACVVTLMVAALIGVTIPDRLRQRRMSKNAAQYSLAYTYSRALLTYQEAHGFIPGPENLFAELKTLPDPDGSIALALQNLDVSGYQPGAVMASSTNKGKSLPVRGEVIRKNTLAGTRPDVGGISFTNYQLRLPGEDKVLNNDDDLIVRDGLVMTLPEYKSFMTPRSRLP
jgi:hypothetical protein